MDLQKLKLFFLRPFRFENTLMRPNILIMCKLLILLLLYHDFYFYINDPYIPFISWLDVFNNVPGVFEVSLRSLFIISTLFLFFNYWVRSASFILGCIIILTILASKPLYFNHILVCGCALFLAGLTHKNKPPYFLVLQLSIIYLGASLNKFLQVDWWSGAFMHNWLFVARENVFYTFVYQFFPEMMLAKIMSIMAIFSELLIGLLLLTKKYRNLAVWIIVIFHTALFTITTIRFGHFLESLAIILISFLHWPKGQMVVKVAKGKFKSFRKVVSFLDFDNKIIWDEFVEKDGPLLEMNSNNVRKTNMNVIKDVLFYSPMFYLVLFVGDVIIRTLFFFNWKYLYTINVFSVWILILFLSPIGSIVLLKNKKASI